jgi:adhesin transport system membrane fusion protein
MNLTKFHYQLVVFPIFLLIMVFLLWSSLMTIGEFVRGEGKIVPSSQVKRVQHLDGGIIAEILVKEGEFIRENQVIYKIRNETALSSLSELKISLNSRIASEARLNAELNGLDEVQFTRELIEQYPSIVDNERKLFKQRRDNFEQSVIVLEQQSSQKKLQLQEERGKVKNLTLQLQYAKEQQQILDRLVSTGAASQKELIESKLRAQNLVTELEDYQNRIQTTEQGVLEYVSRIAETKSKRLVDVQTELSVVLVDIEKLKEQISTNVDRVSRAEIFSPVDGVVKFLSYNTIGGIIRPGDVVAEIIPSNDNLIIEARVAPKDRTRIWPGQKVNVSVGFYSAKFGDSIPGVIMDISADTFLDEGTRSPYYMVRVESNLTSHGENRALYPGMIVEVNIQAGQRTVLAYIMNPILKVFSTSLSEP